MRKLGLILIGIVIIIGAAVIIASVAADPVEEHNFFGGERDKPWVIAHQGGDGLWPGNTMYAFERAAEMGVDVLEMDLHGTADGQLVTIHDATVDRTTDGKGAVNEKSLNQIKELDAGYWWTADDGESYPYRGLGVTVASLDEVFSTFPDHRMNIEIKQSSPSIAESFCTKIREYGMEELVLVPSFRKEALDEFRAVCPEVATSAGRNEVISLFAASFLYLESVLSPQAEAVQVPEYEGSLKVLTQRFVDGAGDRNIEVHAWTINEVEDMERILDLGVDGLITDYPDRLLTLLDR